MIASQKTDIALRYVREIKRRIAVREAAKARAQKDTETAPFCDGAGKRICAGWLAPFALKTMKAHRISGAPIEITIDDHYVNGRRQDFLQILTNESTLLHVPADTVPGLAAVRVEQGAARKVIGELCEELMHLHRLLDNPRAVEFIARCNTVWAPEREEAMPVELFNETVEDFIAAKREKTCKVRGEE